jgi:hypothetical protein
VVGGGGEVVVLVLVVVLVVELVVLVLGGSVVEGTAVDWIGPAGTDALGSAPLVQPTRVDTPTQAVTKAIVNVRGCPAMRFNYFLPPSRPCSRRSVA